MRTTVNTSIRMKKDLRKEIDKFAIRNNKSMNWALNHLLKQALEENNSKSIGENVKN